jgi:hypothetical protein
VSEFIRLDMGHMSKIADNLYLGNIPNALELSNSKWDKFWAILNCTDDPVLDYMQTESKFDVVRLNHWDGQPYLGHSITTGIRYIDENLKANSNVLVCCHAGMSRSPGMMVAYLMHQYLEQIPRNKQTGKDRAAAYKEALRVVIKCRPIIQIHPAIDLSIRQYFGLAPKTAKDLI